MNELILRDLNPVSVATTDGGRRVRIAFSNGFGASVINDGYGSEDGLYELAVLDSEGRVIYDTPVTNDVEGYLTPDDVHALLVRVAELSPRDPEPLEVPQHH